MKYKIHDESEISQPETQVDPYHDEFYIKLTSFSGEWLDLKLVSLNLEKLPWMLTLE